MTLTFTFHITCLILLMHEQVWRAHLHSIASTQLLVYRCLSGGGPFATLCKIGYPRILPQKILHTRHAH